MKANTTVSGTSGVASGRVSRRRDVENEEIQMYISKLRDLVPFIPKNRKLSKLEVIQYVIEYICDLQDALSVDIESEPASNTSSPARTPLGVLAPNTILPPVSCSQEPSNAQVEKSTTPPLLRPARPVSC